MCFLYVLLLSVLLSEALSCISSCWQRGPGSWVGDPGLQHVLCGFISPIHPEGFGN